MSDRDRKLRLVPPTGEQPSSSAREESEEPEETFSEEELEAAAAVREAIERGDEPVSSSLRAAHHPAGLEEPDHDALLARALGEPLAPATRVEAAEAQRLRDALDSGMKAPAGGRTRPSAGTDAESARDLALALRAAYRPPALPPLHNEAMIARALGTVRRRRGRGEIAAAVVSFLALAAGVTLVLSRGDGGHHARSGAAPSAVTMQVALIPARSTMELFDAASPFPRSGEESSRIDRIAAARAADLRANRYSAWGVR